MNRTSLYIFSRIYYIHYIYCIKQPELEDSNESTSKDKKRGRNMDDRCP